MKLKVISAALAAAMIFTAFTAKAQDDVPFQNGEKITFVISYRAKMIPQSDLGEVIFKTESTSYKGIPAFNISAVARTLPMYRWVFDMEDSYMSTLERSTLRPLASEVRIKEGKHRRRSDFTYDWNNGTVTSVFRNLNWKQDSTRTMKIQDGTMDVLSLFYEMRTQDLANFKVGQTRTVEIVSDRRIKPYKYRLVAREDKNIRGVGKFRTLKFAIVLGGEGQDMFEEGAEFYIWLSDDRNKIPVYIESPIKIGSVRGWVSKTEGLKYPLESLIK